MAYFTVSHEKALQYVLYCSEKQGNLIEHSHFSGKPRVETPESSGKLGMFIRTIFRREKETNFRYLILTSDSVSCVTAY